MQPAVEISPEAPPDQACPAFADVPWRWRDLAVGFLTLIAVAWAVSLAMMGMLSPEAMESARRWAWAPFMLAQFAWMLGFPLAVARRLGGVPGLPGPRAFVRESLVALAVVPVLLVGATGLSYLMIMTFGRAVQAANPVAGLAASPDWFQSLTLIAMATTIGPVAEEVFFRGMVFNALRRRINPTLAALLQAVAFGVLHPFGMADRVGVAACGLGFALHYRWRKTLLAPILVHAFLNATSLAVVLWMASLYANAPILGVGGELAEDGFVVVQVVPGGAAEEAGLRAGDVITGVGEHSVASFEDIVAVMRMKKVGDVVPVYFRRDGEDLAEYVTLKARPPLP